MNQRATEYNLNKEEFEQLLDKYIDTIVNSMSMKDFRQYVANDMADFLYNCSESEVVNEFLIKVNHTLDEQFYNKFVKQNKEQLLWTKEQLNTP